MFNVALEKAIYKPGTTRSEKQMTLNAGNAEDMCKELVF